MTEDVATIFKVVTPTEGHVADGVVHVCLGLEPETRDEAHALLDLIKIGLVAADDTIIPLVDGEVRDVADCYPSGEAVDETVAHTGVGISAASASVCAVCEAESIFALCVDGCIEGGAVEGILVAREWCCQEDALELPLELSAD